MCLFPVDTEQIVIAALVVQQKVAESWVEEPNVKALTLWII
jgi:hypothetical protein